MATERDVDGREAIAEATELGLLRVALAFGLTNAVVPVIVEVLSGAGARNLLIGVLWVLAWSVAVANARAVMRMLTRHTWPSFLVAAGLSGLTIAATDGFASPVKNGANWLGWAATVVLPAPLALGLAALISAAGILAFMVAGSTLDHLLSPAVRYTTVTDVLNPFVIVLVALALAGVFRSVFAAAPETLWRIRRGAAASTPGLTHLLTAPPALALRTADEPPRAALPTEAANALPTTTTGFTLTPEERQVVDLLAGGLVPKQIATHLDRTVTTVYDRIATAKRKTGALTIEHLVAITWRSPR